MKLISRYLVLSLALATIGCSTAPDLASGPQSNGRSILEESARRQGTDFSATREVRVSYDGKWSLFPKLTQPVLVDPGFRGSSVEVYRPAREWVEQIHTGPSGEKRVTRQRSEGATGVAYNGKPSTDVEVVTAAGLVADAYTMFLFGASWVLDQGEDFRHLGESRLGGAVCDLVEATMRPGFGGAETDRVVVWIDRETKITRRVHFSLNGLESTRGAEVDVTMDGHVTAPDGGQWPTRFVEMIREPVNTKAHEWEATSLVVDGRSILD